MNKRTHVSRPKVEEGNFSPPPSALMLPPFQHYLYQQPHHPKQYLPSHFKLFSHFVRVFCLYISEQREIQQNPENIF
jgi:hypothetical protein